MRACFDCSVYNKRLLCERVYTRASKYVCVCVLKLFAQIRYRRSKDEIINYICYLNEIQKVSAPN